jgi:hypothetical protein
MNIQGIKHYKLQEWVPKKIFEKFQDQSIRFLRYDTLKMMDDIRDYYNEPITMNTWHKDNTHQYRGYRPPDCVIGSFYSDHKMGLAADFTVQGMTSDEVQKDIIQNWHRIFRHFGVTVLEIDTNGWTHVSRRFTGQNNLVIIKP